MRRIQIAEYEYKYFFANVKEASVFLSRFPNDYFLGYYREGNTRYDVYRLVGAFLIKSPAKSQLLTPTQLRLWLVGKWLIRPN